MAELLVSKSLFYTRWLRKLFLSMGATYPELKSAEKLILATLKAEEEKFLSTLEHGMTILDKEIGALKESSKGQLSGEVAFLLHDTYGFPLDLTEDLAQEQGLGVDREGFSQQMELQRERSRSARSGDAELILSKLVKPSSTKFVGYEFLEYESPLLSIYNSSGEKQSAKEGDEVVLVLEETPFFAESGGQIGDSGRISTANGSIDILDTQKVAGDTFVHIGTVLEGEISVAEQARLEVDESRRRKLALNHSATHLVHLALQFGFRRSR